MTPFLALLAFLGRHGPKAFALSLVLGLMLPGLAASVKPLLGAVIFIFITINMMRADLPAIRRAAASPWYIAGAVAINAIVPFIVAMALVGIWGRDQIDPGLLLGIALAAAAPPLVAAPAYAMLLGFSNTLPLMILILGMAISPVVAPVIADLIAGAAVPLDRFELTKRLAIFLFGAMAAGVAIRWLAGREFLSRRRQELDGTGVVLFFIFAIALTEGVSEGFRTDPWRAAGYTVLAFALCAVNFFVTLLVWRPLHKEDALTLALTTGLRNMGLLVAVMGITTVPDTTFLFFALIQFPVYFAPQLLTPVARRYRSAQAP